MVEIEKYKIEIITGRLNAASGESHKMVRQLLGENAEYRFELYFHWYNLIHELGHAVLCFNAKSRPHPADEEQLVNDFAVAYWRHYGEPEKFQEFCSIVRETIGRFIAPAADSDGFMEYAKENWNQDDFFSFNNYGWFQFHSVSNAISKQQSIGQVIEGMGILNATPQKQKIYKYDIDDEMPLQVIRDAAAILKQWGILLPQDITIKFSEDPNCHMLLTKKISEE